MHRYSFLAAGAAIGLATSVASAADMRLPSRGPVYTPPPAPVLSWTGCYAGLNGGYHWGGNSDVQTVGTPGPFDASQDFGPDSVAAAQGATSTLHPKDNGFIGGGQVGCNWQFAPAWVTGLEADFQGLSNNHDTDSITLTTTAVGFPDTFVSTTTVTKQVDWLGTVRGRLGVLAAPSLLIYGTGGFAYGEAKASTTVAQTATCIFSCLNPPINYGTTASFSETRVGWTVGAGLEWMFAPRWTVRAEYLYYDLGKETLNLPLLVGNAPGCHANPCWSANVQSSTHFNGNIVRAGINYLFN